MAGEAAMGGGEEGVQDIISRQSVRVEVSRVERDRSRSFMEG